MPNFNFSDALTPNFWQNQRMIREIPYWERLITATIIVLSIYFFTKFIKREYRKWKIEKENKND